MTTKGRLNALWDWACRHKAFVIAMPIVAAVGGGLIVDGLSGAADQPARKMTLVEAACDMLRDGESRDFTYEVTEDLADNHPYTYPDSKLAARLAVDQAVDQGCES